LQQVKSRYNTPKTRRGPHAAAMIVTCCVPNDIGGLWGFAASIIEEMLSKIRAPENILKHHYKPGETREKERGRTLGKIQAVEYRV
jgi:hypothetical protein